MKNPAEAMEASVEVGKLLGIERKRNGESQDDIIHGMTHEYFDVLCVVMRALQIAESEVVNAIPEGIDINYFLLTEVVSLGLKYLSENKTVDILDKIEKGFENKQQIIHPAFVEFVNEIIVEMEKRELEKLGGSEISLMTKTNAELVRHISEMNHAIATLNGEIRTGGLSITEARQAITKEATSSVYTS